MNAMVEYVHELIYGSTVLPTNHADWVAANPNPSGSAWLAHYLDQMFLNFNAWNTAQKLPPITPWDGSVPLPWSPTSGSAAPANLSPPFAGIGSLGDLGAALRDRLNAVAVDAGELFGKEKAPFSYRFWAYLKWAKDRRELFLGNPVLPTAVVYDRDGTILSAKVFCDTFNDLHRNWHLGGDAPSQFTPGFTSTVGQRVHTAGGVLTGTTVATDFIRFHRDHLGLYHAWLDRTGQGPTTPTDMGMTGGWPTSGTPPAPPSPWIAKESEATTSTSFQALATLGQVGAIHSGYHNDGHIENADIYPLSHNNYVPRFHMWHGWIDAQWWWREPRFAWSDPVTSERERRFRPVRQDGTDFPDPVAVSIVRDPLAAADTLHPSNAVGSIDLATGNGSLRMKLYVRDPFDRTLRMRLTAEVMDAAGAVVSGLSTVTLKTIGPTGDYALDTDFFVDLPLAGAFASDDPTRLNAAVGFQHARIRVTGELWVPNPLAPDDPSQSTDPGFVHRDVATLDLVREKLAPEPTLSLDLSSFSQGHVDAIAVGGESRFVNAFFLVVQDRTAAAVSDPTWPAELANEVKGLLRGLPAASGLFDDLAHAPKLELLDKLTNAPVVGLSAAFESAPSKEDPGLDPSVPQRHTWAGTIVFAAGHAAFAGMLAGDRREFVLRATVRDRAGNAAAVEQTLTLFVDANPYMNDGSPAWLSIDTRVLSIEAGETRLGSALASGAPRTWLSGVLAALNAGTTGAETFESLPSDQASSALEFAESRVDKSTGTTTPVYNFALAKVRLRGVTGATAVRAFFRLFRYSAPNLLFDAMRGYRAHSDGLGKVIALPGFEGSASGDALLSIPFFAAERLNATASNLSNQTDPLNVKDFPAGLSTEQVIYFGAWLDFNQPSVRLPATFDPANPHGPYPLGTQSLATLMLDFHQCMVVELRYDPDPTAAGASPSGSDNLAQRNLAIVNSANPGETLTRTVEHSFLIDLSAPPALRQARDRARAHNDAHVARLQRGQLIDHPPGPETPLLPGDRIAFDTADAFERQRMEEVMNLGMFTPFGAALMEAHTAGAQPDGHHGHAEAHGEPEGAAVMGAFTHHADVTLRRQVPFVFSGARWTETLTLVDELMLRWGRFPAGTEARLTLSGVSAEEVESLRALRHAPRTVWSEGDGVLRIQPGGVTWIPIPPNRGGRVAALLRLTLPEGVKAGQSHTVDVVQLHGGSAVNKGGVRFRVQVDHADRFFGAVDAGVRHLHAQLSLTPAASLWRPILARRLETERGRARALADYLGQPWTDPTVWKGPDGEIRPVRGPKIRVVLESITVIDDKDPWIKARGEFRLATRVGTPDNGGVESRVQLPGQGVLKLGSGESAQLNAVIFEGFAHSALSIRADLVEEDLFDPDDDLGRYVRTFRGDPEAWFGAYGPDGSWSCEEDMGAWQIRFRVERG